MPLFPLFRRRSPAALGAAQRAVKIGLVKAMSAAELADFGAKPGDVARILREISAN